MIECNIGGEMTEMTVLGDTSLWHFYHYTIGLFLRRMSASSQAFATASLSSL